MFGLKKKSKKQSVPLKNSPASQVAGYEFRLTVDRWGEQQVDLNPSKTDCERAVSALEKSETFLILESESNVNGVTFIQAIEYDLQERSAYVEIQKIEEKDNRRFLRNYGKRIDADELIKIMLSFLSHELIETDGWEQAGDFDL